MSKGDCARAGRASPSRPVTNGTSYGVNGRWRGPQRFPEVQVILVGRMLGWMGYWACADDRGSRLAVCHMPRVGADVPAASSSRSWCRRRGGRARCWRPAHRRWPGRRRAAARTAAAAPRSAGPGPGRAKSPPEQPIELMFEGRIGNATDAAGRSTGHRADRSRLFSRRSASGVGQQMGSNRPP